VKYGVNWEFWRPVLGLKLSTQDVDSFSLKRLTEAHIVLDHVELVERVHAENAKGGS